MRAVTGAILAMALASTAGCEKAEPAKLPEAMSAGTVIYKARDKDVRTLTGKLSVTFYDQYVQVSDDKNSRTVIPREHLIDVETNVLVR